jgi:hypothetical protein
MTKTIHESRFPKLLMQNEPGRGEEEMHAEELAETRACEN